jgi:branched-chain amino acid transport system permease protein
MSKKDKKSFIVSFGIALVIYVALMLMMNFGILNSYWSGICIVVCINIILASSLNLASGYLGQLTLGHAGFMSIGAYTSAILTTTYGMPFIVALIVGALFAAVVGLLIGIPTLRLRGDYLCIITLAFNEIIRIVMLNLNITKGAKGLMGIPSYTTFTVAFLVMAITLFIIYSIVKSRHGRAIISIKEDETASELTGIPTSYYKILAFAVSAFFAGAAGALYAHYMGMLVPKTFDYNKSVEILVMVVLGGLGNFKGAIIAAIVMTILPEYLRAFSDYRMLLYAIVLIAVMVLKEKGILQNIKNKFSKNNDYQEGE